MAIITIDTGTVLTGNGKSPTPLDLVDSGVTPGIYTLAVVNIAVDAKGRVTSIAAGSLAIYDSDADAASGGVAVGGHYELSPANIYGMPAGIIKKRIS